MAHGAFLVAVPITRLHNFSLFAGIEDSAKLRSERTPEDTNHQLVRWTTQATRHCFRADQ